MARFCSYCGKQMGERSKFCSQCGKASPDRKRTAALAVEQTPQVRHGPPAADPLRAVASGQTAERAPVERHPRPSQFERGAERPANGSFARSGVVPASRRFAPRTGSLVGSLEQAGFGLRYGAWMFDFLITLIAMMAFTFAVTAVSNRSVVGSNRDLVLVALLTVLLFVLNFVVLAGAGGQSAGMRILGIRIARLDGRPFTHKDAAVRHLLGYPLSMAAFFLGFLWMMWDPHQQGWHDKLARTIVVVSR